MPKHSLGTPQGPSRTRPGSEGQRWRRGAFGADPKGPCTQIVYTLAPEPLNPKPLNPKPCTFVGNTLRPKYMLFGYRDPLGDVLKFKASQGL